MIRLGLCCLFQDIPIRFRTTTATALARLEPAGAQQKLAALALTNAHALRDTVRWCAAHGIQAFRVNSQILPLRTHPRFCYALADLPGGVALEQAFREIRTLATSLGVRLSFHPDQFVVLSSPRPEVVENSLAELEYQAEVAEWIGADVVNVHAGGVYDGKAGALARLTANLDRLSARARSRLTLENDDHLYTPADLLPLCRATGVPLCYDAHHHRCNGDGASVEATTELAIATWGGREPLFHISSPIEGWAGPKPSRHHDFIDVADFPTCWLDHTLTVDVEAKAKEVAIARLQADLASRFSKVDSGNV